MSLIDRRAGLVQALTATQEGMRTAPEGAAATAAAAAANAAEAAKVRAGAAPRRIEGRAMKINENGSTSRATLDHVCGRTRAASAVWC